MTDDPHIPTASRRIGQPPAPRVRASQRVIGDPEPEPEEPSTISSADRLIEVRINGRHSRYRKTGPDAWESTTSDDIITDAQAAQLERIGRLT